jgi:AMP deaminase
MAVSLQRLGDDPRHHDGVVTGPTSTSTAPGDPESNKSGFKPWNIYPPPPPPHWKFKASNTRTPEISHTHEDGDVPFEFSSCEIPGKGAWEWEMDEKGVFQVYEDLAGEYKDVSSDPWVLRKRLVISAPTRQPLFDVPTIKDFFVDLDTVLSIVTDGPTKSFAFRRLKYLSSKWQMYSLLNEYQELADMKVCFNCPLVLVY